MGKLTDFFLKFFKGFLRFCLAVILFMIVTGLLMSLFTAKTKKAVGSDVPSIFPVLVITETLDKGTYKAEIVPYKDFNGFKQERPRYTLLVPKGIEAQLRSQVQKNNYSKEQWFANYEVKEVAKGRQALKVDFTWDDDRVNTGWYEATDKEIFPKYHQFYFGPEISLPVLPLSIILTIIIWNMPRLLKRFTKKKSDFAASKP